VPFRTPHVEAKSYIALSFKKRQHMFLIV